MSSLLSPLPPPSEIENDYPLSPHYKQIIHQNRKVAENILRGEDERFIIFAGPCSIHDQDIALQYASQLKKLSEKVEDRIFLIMRVFLEKPRTQFGWKGFLYDPDLDGTNQIDKGLISSRKLLMELMKFEIPIATEFLDPFLLHYHHQFFTWGIVGARTSASQVHRQMASYLNMPVGFKNETDGTLDNAICGALAARHPQTSIGIDEDGRICTILSQGNPYTHLILRGSSEHPNYDELSVSEAIHRQRVFGLSTPLVIDCAHGNSQKNPKKQIDVFFSVLDQIMEGNHLIVGSMLESHLQEGHAISITDPCLDWKTTEEIILKAHSSLTSVLTAKRA
ncbi:3-deoxy-7-phosphoheptulonate synthase [Simkania negevensis]|uniref:Phospho-2-dehydro-3-deoxyheptonate aldolase n=1 Tax=Simkania negevensis (strain ATCC VR-1471 / DSM 27360 / Z) TaxID=331113 RepID=F8L940_SIMNZ|nr:3-deoxy-7-phosphoheptulonate synthase [Simkania negevensis]CCB89355.1 phospho-2-dehydro-3-deoxyheptonate aldolase,Tyr-sensitive [Simkania negevensis Z]